MKPGSLTRGWRSFAVALGGALALGACALPEPESAPPPVRRNAVVRLGTPADAKTGLPRPTLEKTAATPFPEVAEGRLKNGTRVLVVNDARFRIVSVGFVISRGSSAGAPGLAEAFVYGLDGASPDSSRQETAELAHTLGAKVTATTAVDGVVLGFSALEPLWPTVFRRLAKVVASPKFESSDVANDREWLSARYRNETPVHTAKELALGDLFGEKSPLAARATESERAAIGPRELRAFYKANVSPDTLTLVFAGPVTLQEALVEGEGEFPDFEKRALAPQPRLPAAPHDATFTVHLENRLAATQSEVALVLPGPAASSDDRAALEVAVSMLGGTLGSRLSQRIRGELGAAYVVGAHTSCFRDTGYVVASAGAHPEATGATLRAITTELEKLVANEASAEEVARAKRVVLAKYADGYFGAMAATSTVANAVLDGTAPNSVPLAQAIDRVTPAAVHAAAVRYLNPAHGKASAVGPIRAMEASLRAAGYGESIGR